MNKDVFAMLKYAESWRLCRFQELDYSEYLKAFKTLHRVTKMTKYRDFQYCLLLNKLVFNGDLYDWGKKDLDLCTFCGKSREDTRHSLLECDQVASICEEFSRRVNRANMLAEITFDNIILNNFVKPDSHVFNEIGLIIKQSIYSHRCMGNTLYNI